MARITVTHRHGQSFDVRVRGYALISDEPVTLGGDDEGPTPTELMVAGLAACAADEVVKALAAMGQAFESTEVGADFEWDLEAGRVAGVEITAIIPTGVSEEARTKALEAILECPARKMLMEPPRLEYRLRGGTEAVLAGPVSRSDSWPREAAADADSQ